MWARNCRKLPLQSSRPGSLSNVAELIRLQTNVAQEIRLMWSLQTEKLVKDQDDWTIRKGWPLGGWGDGGGDGRKTGGIWDAYVIIELSYNCIGEVVRSTEYSHVLRTCIQAHTYIDILEMQSYISSA